MKICSPACIIYLRLAENIIIFVLTRPSTHLFLRVWLRLLLRTIRRSLLHLLIASRFQEAMRDEASTAN